MKLSRQIHSAVLIRSEDFMAAKIQTVVFWVMTPCDLADGYQIFGTYWILLQDRRG
jgi:hypothetical protein